MSTAQDTIDARRAKQIEEEFEAERPAREIGPLLSKVLALGLVPLLSQLLPQLFRAEASALVRIH